ncbi:MAG: hypothetical protein RLZZ142_739 [Verrucomicrobiota bacterium]
MKAPSPASDVPALHRGIRLLEWIAHRPSGATLSEAAEDLHFPLPSVLRLARALEELGYLRRDERSKRFSLTSRLLLIGQPQSSTQSLSDAARDPMRRILEATGETTQLCCLADSECVLLDQLPSPHAFKYVVDLGSRTSPHCCAPGKAILAFLPDSRRAEILSKLTLQRHTPHTLTSRKALESGLKQIRKDGFALDQGEHFEGIHCVAAPILDRHGHALAAITIAGPASRIPSDRFLELGRLIAQAAADASTRFLG